MSCLAGIVGAFCVIYFYYPNIFLHIIKKKEINFLDIKSNWKKECWKQISKPNPLTHTTMCSTAHHTHNTAKIASPYNQFLRVRWICSQITDYDYNVVKLGRHFLQRGYLIETLEEKALLARRKNCLNLLHLVVDTTTSKENNDKVFIITNFHPHDTSVRNVAFKNLEILGTSSTSTHIDQKKLTVGYIRLKNLRDSLVRTAVKPIARDERYYSNHIPQKVADPVITNQEQPTPGVIQLKIDPFLIKHHENYGEIPLESHLPSILKNPKPLGTSSKDWGFNICIKILCKYCKILNKTGAMTCHPTGMVYTSCTTSAAEVPI